jgi:hypothetical protein
MLDRDPYTRQQKAHAVVAKLAVELARQAAREDHAEELERRGGKLCASQFTPDTPPIFNPNDQ